MNRSSPDAAWYAWLAEANEIMRMWEAANAGQLTTAEKADLVRRTAAALQAAAERSNSQWVYSPTSLTGRLEPIRRLTR